MSHHRALIAAMALSAAALVASCLPVAYRWRWRLLLAGLGLILGYGVL